MVQKYDELPVWYNFDRSIKSMKKEPTKSYKNVKTRMNSFWYKLKRIVEHIIIFFEEHITSLFIILQKLILIDISYNIQGLRKIFVLIILYTYSIQL